MAENLGDMLRQNGEERERKERERRDQIQRAKEECDRLALEAALKEASAFLEKLKSQISQDIASGKWDKDHQGLVYHLWSRDRSHSYVRWTPIPELLAEKNTSVSWRQEYDYFIGSETIWAEFVSWLRDNGLSGKVEEAGHMQDHGEVGCWEHDYYYILLRPFETEIVNG
jgi:hypothetical protein